MRKWTWLQWLSISKKGEDFGFFEEFSTHIFHLPGECSNFKVTGIPPTPTKVVPLNTEILYAIKTLLSQDNDSHVLGASRGTLEHLPSIYFTLMWQTRKCISECIKPGNSSVKFLQDCCSLFLAAALEISVFGLAECSQREQANRRFSVSFWVWHVSGRRQAGQSQEQVPCQVLYWGCGTDICPSQRVEIPPLHWEEPQSAWIGTMWLFCGLLVPVRYCGAEILWWYIEVPR